MGYGVNMRRPSTVREESNDSNWESYIPAIEELQPVLSRDYSITRSFARGLSEARNRRRNIFALAERAAKLEPLFGVSVVPTFGITGKQTGFKCASTWEGAPEGFDG